jgi:hemerythrin-like domain-containing protein
MQVTHELMNEHQMILKYLDLMERYIEFSKIDRDENLFLEHAQDFVNIIHKFADTYHHVKEEDILFKYMDGPDVLPHCNPLPVMLNEHEIGRKYLQDIKNDVANANLENLCKNIDGYCQNLRQHIFKEDNVLYPMAEEGISEDDKIAIENEYKQIEEKLGKQKLWNEFKEKCSKLENYMESKIAAAES